MAPTLSLYTKQRITALYKFHKKHADIVSVLAAENIVVSRQTVSKIIFKINTTGSVANKPKSGRKRLVNVDVMNFIDISMEKNDECTSVGKIIILSILYTKLVPSFPNC